MASSTNDLFIHLRVHTTYSLSEGAIKIGELADLCKKYKMPAVAITDSGNLFGSLEFSKTCAENGIQPIVGCVVAVDCLEKNTDGFHREVIYDKIVLIAKNEAGYHNLLKIVSRSFLDTEDVEEPHIPLSKLEQLNEGVIALTGGLSGPLGRLCQEGQQKEAEEILLRFNTLFKEHLYVEISRHNLANEDEVNEWMIDQAYKHNIPLVATNDVYFSKRHMHEAQDALLCIADGRYLVEDERRKLTPEHFFKTTREMKQLFADIPEAVENTVNIAKRCSVMSCSKKPMLPHFTCEEGRTEEEELKAQSIEGLKERLEVYVFTEGMTEEEKKEKAKPYFERLDYELGVINDMKFPGYFLIVSDFIKWSKENEVPVGPGRGSGAGSVVAWSLKITDLDPLRFGLLFERFLNPERISMPDFDVDFCQEKRDRVIRYVQEKYGYDKVAQIITFGKLQARAVLRDVGRVLQMPYNQVDRLCKMIPFNPLEPVTLSKAIEMDRDLQREQKNDPEVGKLIDIGLKLEGLFRHASTHAAGVVIADRSLEELIPVYRDPRSDMPVTGYSMKYAESAGLVKFDFLGLKTLTIIQKACELIQARGIDIDIATISLDDKKTFEILAKGDSIGVFQLESPGMRDTLRKLKPDNIDDIIALISLYRPGPMDNIPSYIARKHGDEEPDYLDPMLEEVLKETYGVIIYQEQVMQIAQIMGGYSLGGADLLRRAMGKKIASEMDAQRKIFVEGALKNNVSQKKASSIFDLVAKFAGYGFNKSHAAAYALISYQTAYLKANHYVEFMAASMNLDIGDTDKINVFCQELKEHKTDILLPDINHSGAYFKPELKENKEYAIRYALGALKNVGVAAMREMEKERDENGKFTDIFEFASRQDSKVLNKRMMESLTAAGAYDCIHKNRRQIFEETEKISRYGTMCQDEKDSQQVSMFSAEENSELHKPKLLITEDWKGKERLTKEFEAIGLYLANHPLDSYQNMLSKMKVVNSGEFQDKLPDGNSTVKLAGVITAKRIRSSQRGRFATVNLSDPFGMYELNIYDEDLLNSIRDLLENGVLLFVEAEARKDEGGIRFIANKITALDNAIDRHHVTLEIHVSDNINLENIKNLLGEKGQGQSKVAFIINSDNKEIKINLPGKYPLKLSSIPLIEDVEHVLDVKEA